MTDYPERAGEWRRSVDPLDPERLMARMGLLRHIMPMLHSVRKKAAVSVRHPIPAVYLWGSDPVMAFDFRAIVASGLKDILLDEINCKEAYAIPWVDTPWKENGVTALVDNGILLALDMRMTPELTGEGICRDIKRGLQVIRQDMGLGVQNRVRVTLDVPDDIKAHMAAHGKQLQEDLLCDEMTFGPCAGGVVKSMGRKFNALVERS